MSIAIRSWNANEVEPLRSLASHPSLQREFEMLQGHGLEQRLADAWNPEPLRFLASLDGRDAGFAYSFVVPMLDGVRAMARIGVVDGARRRGLGRALLESTLAALPGVSPECRSVGLVATLPNADAAAFANRVGFVPVRRFWLMEREPSSIPEPALPAGVRVEGYGGIGDIARWVKVFNCAWLEHWHAVLATEPDFRRQIESGAIAPEGMFLASDETGDVGFVRLALHEGRGEIAVLGVVPEWRRRGLGRALLQFGGRWLIEHGARRVTLLVDGENERALALYRNEYYEVVETRQFWEHEL